MSRKTLTEAGKVTTNKTGKLSIQAISPGWGSSGYYSAEVLKAAADAKVFAASTHCYIDHPTATEDEDRPGRSVKDIAGILLEDATWSEEAQALVAPVQVVGPYKEALIEMRDAIGVSIRAAATVDVGEAEGRTGLIVQEIHPDTFNSVDFVTHAGRGGKILEVLESARAAIAESVSDKPWSDFSQSDYDDAQWKRACLIDTGDGEGKARYKLPVKEPSGALNRNAVHAAAGRIGQADVSADLKKAAAKKLVSLYRNQLDEDPPKALLTAAGMSEAASESATPNVPVHPAGQSTTTKEHTMPDIEEGAKVSILETKLRTLEADAGRVPALEAKVVAESARADKAEQDLAVAAASEYARTFGVARVKESNGDLPSAVVDKIVADAMREIPLTEADKAVDRRLDTEAFGKRVDESQKAEETYLASIVENGSGHVRGVGSTEGKAEVSEAQVDNIVAGAFGRIVKGA